MNIGSVSSVASYIASIQDLIGNSGKTVQITTSYKGSHSTGLKQPGTSSASDSVSLSIAAIQKLATQQKGLQAGNSTVDGSSGASNSAQDFLSNPTSTFKNYVNSLGGPEKWADGIFSKEDRASFVKAFNEGSLTVQSAVDVKGLDYNETTTLTGTSEYGSLSINHAYYDSQATSTQGGGLVELPAIGGLFYTFPRKASSTVA